MSALVPLGPLLSSASLDNCNGAIGAGVLVEQGHARERLVAHLASVLLDIYVRLLVSAQIGAIGEGARAVGALKRLLARMGAYVTLQQPWA